VQKILIINWVIPNAVFKFRF